MAGARTRPDGSGWTREELLRRAAAGTLALGGAFAPRFVADSAAALAASAPTVHRFHTRPDIVTPVLTVLQKHPGASEGHLFIAPNSGPGKRGALLLDGHGQPLWFRDSHPVVAMNFRAGIYKGKPVLTWWEGKTERGLGEGTHIVMDDRYREVLRLPAGNGRPSDLHEFVLTDRGTALVTSWEVQTRDLRPVGGPSSGHVVGGIMQELELPSGRVLFEWRSFDHVALTESHAPYTNHGGYDAFHINSVALDHDGNYLVSARNTWAIYKIHRGTGEVMWRLGGKKSDFAMGPGTTFAWQHDARRHGSADYHLSLFDDGAMPAVQPQSKALILALDLKRMRATLHRKYTHHPRVLAWALGSTQVLANGNVLVGWGTAPYITEYSADGKVLFDARLPKGGENYRALRLPWVGRPATKPDVIVRYIKGQHLVYVSWNGATEVSHWRVTAPGYETSHPRTGFETEIVAPAGVKRVTVTPVDRHGRPLHPGVAAKV